MTCLACGAKETHYLMRGYPVCEGCLKSTVDVRQSEPRINIGPMTLRALTAIGAFQIGLLASMVINWIGGME